MKVTIEDVSLTGENGVYTITSNLVLTVDQANDNHEAKLVFASNNTEDVYLKVTFTPASNAPQTIKENAVASKLYFGTTSVMQYKMDNAGNYDANGTAKDIFEFVNPESAPIQIGNDVWTKESDGSFTYTMNQSALEAQIKLSQTFKLDIKAEHDAFGTALSGNVFARITDGVVTQ